MGCPVTGDTFPRKEMLELHFFIPKTCALGLFIQTTANVFRLLIPMWYFKSWQTLKWLIYAIIVHFTVVCPVTQPPSGSEAGADPALTQTLPPFICKYKLVSMRTTWFTREKQKGLHQNKVNSSPTSTQRPGHQAHNCKMDYCQKMRPRVVANHSALIASPFKPQHHYTNSPYWSL